MKNSLINQLFLGSLTASFALAQDESDWTVKLIQTHLESAGVFQGEVNRAGSGPSFAPIPEGGSEFTLWAFRQGESGLEEHLVDSEIVGTYLPSGTLSITTADPYSAGIPRTRVDQGFTLHYDVDGLESSPDAPKAARQVLLDHKLTLTQGGATGPEQDFNQVFISRNGPDDLVFGTTNLPISDPFSDSGVESFSLFALADGEVASLELSSAQVQVWPLATAVFSGTSSSRPFTTAPAVSIDLTNLYPSSETWVQFYPGPPVVGKIGTRINGSTVLVVDDVEPRDTVITLTTLNQLLTSDGVWTLEVLTSTPFGVESLSTDTLSIDRNLTLRASFQILSDS